MSEGKEGYQPSEEELNDASDRMTEAEKAGSKIRAEAMKVLGTTNAEIVNAYLAAKSATIKQDINGIETDVTVYTTEIDGKVLEVEGYKSVWDEAKGTFDGIALTREQALKIFERFRMARKIKADVYTVEDKLAQERDSKEKLNKQQEAGVADTIAALTEENLPKTE